MGGATGQQGGGGDMAAAIGRMIGQQSPWEEPTPLPSPPPNPFGNPDPNVFINREPGWASAGYDPSYNQLFNVGSFGQIPSFGNPISGPTPQPTFWSSANTGNPGVFAPLAIPPGGWTPDQQLNIGIARHFHIPKPS